MNLLKKRPVVQLKVAANGVDRGQVWLGTNAGPELCGRSFVAGEVFELPADRAEAVLADIGAWLEVVEPETEERG